MIDSPCNPEAYRFAQAALDALSAHIAVLDQNGTILAVNAAWCAFAHANGLGRHEGNWIGVNYLAVCDAAQGDGAVEAHAFAQGIRAVLCGERDRFTLEYACHSPEEWRWFSGQVTPTLWEGTVYAVVAHNDITERKRAEEKTHEVQEFLTTLLDYAPTPIHVTTAEGRYSLVNRAWEACFLYRREAVIGRRRAEFMPARTAQRFDAICQRIVETGAPITLDEDTTANGGSRFFHAIKFPLRDASGQVEAVGGISVDITELKQMEAALTYSNERLRLIAQVTDAVVGAASLKDQALALARQVRQAFNVDACVVRVLEDTDLALLASDGIPEPLLLPRLSADQGIAREIVSSHRPLAIPNVRAHPVPIVNTLPHDYEFQSYAGAPLLAEDRVVGILGIYSLQEREFSEADLTHLQIVANHIAVSILNHRLYQEIESQKRLLEEQVAERKRSEEDLRHIMAGARCLLWYADVEETGADLLTWHMQVPDEEAAQRFLPIEVAPGENYAQAWLNNRLPEDRERTDAYGSQETRAGRGYSQEFRCRRFDGENRWLSEDVYIEPVAPGRWRAIGVCTDITEKKRAERQAQEAQIFISTLLEHVPAPVYVTSLDGRWLLVNRALEETFERTRDQMIGHLATEVVPPAVAQRFQASNRQVQETGMPIIVEQQVETPHGPRHYHTVKFPLHDLQGQIHAVGGISFDITDRIQVDMALREERQLLRTLLDNLPQTIYVRDIAGRFMVDNAAHARALGAQAPEAIVGKHMMELLPRRLAVRDLADDQRVIRSGKPRIIREEQGTDREGRRRWYSTTKVPLCDTRGVVVGIVGLSQDITERKQAMQSLKDSEALYHSLVESLPLSVFRKDLEGKFTFANGRFLAGIGRSLKQLRGKADYDFFPRELAEKYRQDDRRVVETGQTFEDVEAHQLPDGKTLYVQVLKTPVHDARGKIVGVQGMFWDITERKQAAAALEQQAQELARSNAELEQFAYVASHDLQEPLRMVASYTQLINRRYADRLDQDAREFIGYAVDGTVRMQALIKDLLAYSRVGTRGNEFSRVEGQWILKTTLANLQTAIEESGATLTCDPLPTLLADGSQLAQVFQNLIGNALKFRGERPPQIHIGAVRKGSEWEFSIRDNGIGIEEQYAERIFVIFQRLHTRDQYPGTGIGLAICKKIIERHKGRIWLESQPGEGTTFFFTLPA